MSLSPLIGAILALVLVAAAPPEGSLDECHEVTVHTPANDPTVRICPPWA